MGRSVRVYSEVYAKLVFVGVVVALVAHTLIAFACAWWWEVYKANVNWSLHSDRPMPSPLYLFSAPPWFWVDLVITIILFSSFATLIVFVILLARVIGLPRGWFALAVSLYHVLLIASWIWYEIFRANVRIDDRVNPSSNVLLYMIWGDFLYIFTVAVGFLSVLVFVYRVAIPRIEEGLSPKRCRTAVLWIALVLELYALILISSYIWLNLVTYVSGERLSGWYFPSPFYLWKTPIYAWANLAYILTLAVFAVIAGITTYREIKLCRA